MGGGVSEGHDDLGPDKGDLCGQPFPTGGHFFSGGHSVFRRPTLHHVGDVHLFPGDLSALQDGGEELPGRAYEGPARLVFHLARCLANQHEIGRHPAFPKHQVRARLPQWTTGTGTHTLMQSVQSWLKTRQAVAPPGWSGQRESNPRPSAWEADALPTELCPLPRGNYTRFSRGSGLPRRAWAHPGESSRWRRRRWTHTRISRSAPVSPRLRPFLRRPPR